MDFATDEDWQELVEHGQLDAAIVEFIRHRDETIYSEIQDAFEEYITTRGEQGIALRSDPNVVLWLNMSQDLAAALAKLISTKKLYVHPTTADKYGSDKDGISLPLMEDIPENRVSRPVWLPTFMTDLPPDRPNSRLSRIARMKLNK